MRVVFYQHPWSCSTKVAALMLFVISALLLVHKSTGQTATPYHVVNDLPAVSLSATAGNPLKGFLTSPLWVSPTYALTDVPTSLDFYYVPLRGTMTDFNTFDWTYLESLLNGSAGRSRHAVLRFMLDYPKQQTHVPQFLIDGGLQFNNYTSHGGGLSPDYNDVNLLTALQQFITAFGSNYDGDSRIGFIQLGLLGYWGEWHTFPETQFLDINNPTRDSVALWYRQAFSVTPLQVRYPRDAKRNGVNIGLHDDSFAYATLGGVSWHFWPQVTSYTYTDFWKSEVMGGEVYPSSQATCFSATFGIPTSSTEQEVPYCIETTHATYMLLHKAFAMGGYTGDDLTRCQEASNLMGYAFAVSHVEAFTESTGTQVDIAVEVSQVGVAPFYYPLSLKLSCDVDTTMTVNGLENIISKGDSSTFLFSGVPATSACLNQVTLSLTSSHTYADNPMKLAQGTTGKVEITIPLPPTNPSSVAPTVSPGGTCLAAGEGMPCGGTTNCCSGIGNCSGGKPSRRSCL